MVSEGRGFARSNLIQLIISIISNTRGINKRKIIQKDYYNHTWFLFSSNIDQEVWSIELMSACWEKNTQKFPTI